MGVDLIKLTNIESQSSFIEALNTNLENLAAALDKVLYRVSGQDVNQMEQSIDMNGKRVMNLGSPESASDAPRWQDIYAGVTLTNYAIPALAGNSGKFLSTDGLTVFWSNSGGALLGSNNLSDVLSPTAARTNLGLGSAATYNIGTTGSNVPLLSGSNSWGGGNAFLGTVTIQGGGQFSGNSEFRLATTGLMVLSEDSVGYRGAPQRIKDADYTFVLDDAGRGITHTSGTAHQWTIPPDSSVNFPTHTIITLDNYGTGAVTVKRGSGVTLRANGSGTSADQTLSSYQVRSLYKIGPNFWVFL